MLQQLKIREKSAPQGQPAFCTSHPGPCPPQARRAAASRWQFSWAVGIHPWVSRGLGPGLFCPRIWLHSSATLIWPRHKIPPRGKENTEKTWNLGTELTTHPGWGAVWMLWNIYSSLQAQNCSQHVLWQFASHPTDTALCRTMVKSRRASESQNLFLSWKIAYMRSSRAAKICPGFHVDRGCCQENWKSGPTMWCHLFILFRE